MRPLASIKIQHLNLDYFFGVSTIPPKSFTEVSSGLGGKGLEMAIGNRFGNFLFFRRNLKVMTKERKCPK